jgi:hypothetical protein
MGISDRRRWPDGPHLAAAALLLLPTALAALGCAGGAGGAAALRAEEAALAGLYALDRGDGGGGGPAALAEVVANHDATLLLWWSTSCPCVKRYHARIEAIRAAYPADRVAVLAVASNADDPPARLRTVAAERGLTVPLLVDPGAALADRLGVRSTPTVVVLDRTGAVRFFGWIDNERVPGAAGRVPYAREALDALLAGRAPPHARSPFYGCTITRSIGAAGRCAGPPAPP